MKRRYFLILTLILVLGATLRFYKLGEIPSSLNWDEVSWGYNAYSILETGKDEYGTFMPLSFKAFGDYKQPLYVYSQLLPIKLFGLEAFAVRFPSAFFGTLTIVSVYLLTRQLFPRNKKKETVALTAAALFAISPWAIQFSRVAFEANVAAFFIITGAWLFLKGTRDKKVLFLALSLLVISLSSFTYHSAKVFTPLLVATLFLTHYKYFLANKKTAVILALVYMLINSIWLIDMRTTSRGRSVVFTAHQTEILKKSTEYIEQDKNTGEKVGTLIHNRRIVYSNTYLQNYLSHFDLNFLFIKGDNARHHAPRMGVLYLTLLPVIILGIIRSFEEKGKGKWILFAWVALAPVASSLAVDAPNASRSLTFLPTWQIFAALGAVYLFEKVRKKKVLLGIISLIFLANVIYYLEQYFVHTNTQQSEYWQYGYSEAVEFAKEQEVPVYFTDTVEQAYIFYLFHTQYPPQKYLELGGSAIRENTCYAIENAHFGTCDIEGSHFIVADEGEDIEEEQEKTIYLQNNEEAIKIYRKS